MLKSVSVIIPLAPGETKWRELLQQLETYAPDLGEVLLVASSGDGSKENLPSFDFLRWLSSPKGRAQQQNAGARASMGQWLWFLHADSRVSKESIDAIRKVVSSDVSKNDSLHFFRLKFLDDGPKLMFINEIGVRIRSEILKMPFGDQGFLISKKLFERLGYFQEAASFGEDHLLVWKARQSKVKIKCLNVPIYTSARKYRERGWSSTTAKHMYLTWKQAIPEMFRLIE